VASVQDSAAAENATGDGPVVLRLAGRVLVVDSSARVLLLHGYDPAEPGEPYWFTVGGGAKPGESLTEAAARELREETGLVVQPSDLGAPVWHEVTEFGFDGTRYRQEQDFFLWRAGKSPEVRTEGMADEEAAFVDGHRWWSVAELEATSESFYPVELPSLLRELLD
jgi:8-oxo-dGTP pyrophosphatase MutT (NUDIX family)